MLFFFFQGCYDDQHRAWDTLCPFSIRHCFVSSQSLPLREAGLAQSAWQGSSETDSVGGACGFHRHMEERPVGCTGCWLQGLDLRTLNPHTLEQILGRTMVGGTLHWSEPRGVQSPGHDGRS